MLWSKLGAALGSAFWGPAGRELNGRGSGQQYAVRPAGHWTPLWRAAMEEAETLAAKAATATKEMMDFWKNIV